MLWDATKVEQDADNSRYYDKSHFAEVNATKAGGPQRGDAQREPMVAITVWAEKGGVGRKKYPSWECRQSHIGPDRCLQCEGARRRAAARHEVQGL